MKLNPLQGIVFSALFAALMVVLSFVNIYLPFNPVPFTLENMGPMLAGAFLGPWYGFLSIFMVVGLTAIGLPLMHGQAGIAFVLGPTGGFIWMFPISALLTGLFVSRIKGSGIASYVKVFFAIWLCGLTVYIAGLPWLAYKANLNIEQTFALGFTPFILGDTLKALAATLVVVPVRRIIPVLGGGNLQVADLRDRNM